MHLRNALTIVCVATSCSQTPNFEFKILLTVWCLSFIFSPMSFILHFKSLSFDQKLVLEVWDEVLNEVVACEI